jgi:hypothetical protein
MAVNVLGGELVDGIPLLANLVVTDHPKGLPDEPLPHR